jgi:hypothetical protein
MKVPKTAFLNKNTPKRYLSKSKQRKKLGDI